MTNKAQDLKVPSVRIYRESAVFRHDKSKNDRIPTGSEYVISSLATLLTELSQDAGQ